MSCFTLHTRQSVNWCKCLLCYMIAYVPNWKHADPMWDDQHLTGLDCQFEMDAVPLPPGCWGAPFKDWHINIIFFLFFRYMLCIMQSVHSLAVSYKGNSSQPPNNTCILSLLWGWHHIVSESSPARKGWFDILGAPTGLANKLRLCFGELWNCSIHFC